VQVHGVDLSTNMLGIAKEYREQSEPDVKHRWAPRHVKNLTILGRIFKLQWEVLPVLTIYMKLVFNSRSILTRRLRVGGYSSKFEFVNPVDV